MVVTVAIRRKGSFAALGRKILTAITGPRHVKVGLIEGQADQLNINKAMWNEFGTKGGGWGGPIPERPFMRTAVAKTNADLKPMMKSAARSILTGRATMRQQLSKMGIKGQQDMRDTIASGAFAANSPTTIKLKGSSKPLVDTGEMSRNVTWQIDE